MQIQFIHLREVLFYLLRAFCIPFYSENDVLKSQSSYQKSCPKIRTCILYNYRVSHCRSMVLQSYRSLNLKKFISSNKYNNFKRLKGPFHCSPIIFKFQVRNGLNELYSLCVKFCRNLCVFIPFLFEIPYQTEFRIPNELNKLFLSCAEIYTFCASPSGYTQYF